MYVCIYIYIYICIYMYTHTSAVLRPCDPDGLQGNALASEDGLSQARTAYGQLPS